LAEKKRFIFVDLLRGLALLVMIEVHVFNAFLDPSIKNQTWFIVLNFINGLVAPSFLFVSGFAFILSTNTSAEKLKIFTPAILKRLSRIGMVFLVGYSLHLPGFPLSEMLKLPEAEFMTVYIVDVLQCIASGLLLLLIMKLISPNEKVFNAILLSGTLIFIFLSPVIWQYDFTNHFPLWLANYFNTKHGSLFPLFPWLGFMFTGAITAIYFLCLKETPEQKRFINHLVMIGVTFVIITHLVLSQLSSAWISLIRPNPFFFMQRLGYVLILLGICWHYDFKRNIKKSFILDFSRESLLVYWFHLTVLFALIWNGKSLAAIVNYNFGIWECIAATIILVFLMIAAAKIWGWFKMKNKKAARVVTISVLSLSVFLFLIL
jgi:uncharacterized membrane protein